MRHDTTAHLLLLLPTAFGITSVNLKKQPNYLQEYEKSSIEFTTCEEVTDLFDDADYADYLGENCHYTHYENKRVEDDYPGVRSCCPIRGHISRTKNCQGKDKDGNEAVFDWAEACVKSSGEGKYEISERINLECKGNIVKGTYDGTKEKLMNNNQVLQVGNSTYKNFCFGIKCDSNEEMFEYRYEACSLAAGIKQRFSSNDSKCCGIIFEIPRSLMLFLSFR